MDKWIVEPLKKVNDIAFGMSREEARKIMNREYSEFKKSKFSKNTTDDFGNCHIFYNIDNKVEAMEVFSAVEVEIYGKRIFPDGFSELEKIVNDLKNEDGCYISTAMSIGVTMDGNTMDSILFGCIGYYS